jgi:hypothetical protein
VGVVHEPNPTAARRELALYFRNVREQRKRGLDELAEYLAVSEAQASRLDKGARGLRPGDVRRLATWYELPDTERDRLLALATESRKRGWWQQVDLGESYRTLIGMEQAADTINEYCHSVIPGLLQTRDYARAAAAGSAPDLSPEQIKMAVDVRMRRQQVLKREQAPRLSVVIDEAALARTTGGPAVMREQLEHLISATVRPGITVQIIDFEYGTHPGDSHFILVRTGGVLPNLVYLEALGRADSTSDSDIARYRRVWEHLTALALSPRESRDRIERYVKRLAP